MPRTLLLLMLLDAVLLVIYGIRFYQYERVAYRPNPRLEESLEEDDRTFKAFDDLRKERLKEKWTDPRASARATAMEVVIALHFRRHFARALLLLALELGPFSAVVLIVAYILNDVPLVSSLLALGVAAIVGYHVHQVGAAITKLRARPNPGTPPLGGGRG